MELSPMMKQYMGIKEQYKDCILFFRLGDFYEMFFDDAIIASKELEITLTGKNCGQEERAPMCGVPFHSADTYIARLVERGYKVAICEQVEDASATRGIVKREVVQVVTPGTIISQNMLNEKENNYLASIFLEVDSFGLAYCDITTGELFLTDININNWDNLITNQLAAIKPSEIIINDLNFSIDFIENIKGFLNIHISELENHFYNPLNTERIIKKQFTVSSIQGLGFDDNSGGARALGGLLSYLLENKKQNLSHINSINIFDLNKFMSLDKSTIKNLELTETIFEKKITGSLLGVLDKTQTAMGSRKLKQWIREPLNDAFEINMRLDSVEALLNNILIRNNIKESLKSVYDLERLAGRISFGNANGKDLIALKNSLAVLPDIKENLSSIENDYLSSINDNISYHKDLYSLIEASILDDTSFTIKEGGIIKKGYSKKLDDLKLSIVDGQEWIAGLESKERERTGIKNLKVGYNKVFGYYIEITKSNYDMTPDNYIRKQTLSNCERYITPELKEMESIVLNAETKINQLEYTIFLSIRNEINLHIKEIQASSKSIAIIDALASFAEVSSRNSYIKPVINNSDKIIIEKGRHPVIEQLIKDGIFVSNDTYVDCDMSSLLLITGPNMAGKSTYMRQTALIVLLAQIGCFVPCEYAEIGVVDRIYTRIGASDNLSQGQSTFFVEMSELAYILNTATKKSLIILDEIGRGTSTYDGLSIAWSVIEYLCLNKNGVRTLFATHYHELTRLEGELKGIRNLNVDVAEENGNIIFLHKIVEGSASRSYGIHVAKIAGVPSDILMTAERKLHQLESANKSVSIINEQNEQDKLPEPKQLSFFDQVDNSISSMIKNINPMDMTPSEAIKFIEELKVLIK